MSQTVVNIFLFKVVRIQILIRRSQFFSWVLAVGMAVSLIACGGGVGGNMASTNPITGTLGGVAAVGSPIVNGSVNILCASGGALATTTGTTGAWQISLREQSLPCAVQIAGGMIGATPNTVNYHAVGTAKGNVNLTPLTDLVVANMVGTATPAVWFSGLATSRSAIAGISVTHVTAAVEKLRAAMPELTVLASIHPIATSFDAIPGNPNDDVLAALQTAMNSTGFTHASLLRAASTVVFTALPEEFSVALRQAYENLTVSPRYGFHLNYDLRIS